MNKPIDISEHPILQQAFDVIQSIEKCGASVELTNAVTEAGKLMNAINQLLCIHGLKGDHAGITDGDINALTLDHLGKWPSFEAQSWACKVAHTVLKHAAPQNTVSFATIRFAKHLTLPDGSKPEWNEMPKVVSCNWLPDGYYKVYLAPQTAITVQRPKLPGQCDSILAHDAYKAAIEAAGGKVVE